MARQVGVTVGGTGSLSLAAEEAPWECSAMTGPGAPHGAAACSHRSSGPARGAGECAARLIPPYHSALGGSSGSTPVSQPWARAVSSGPAAT